ncbi:MAG: hypothetical protein J6A22_02820 [Bacteroidales bacterium]|nr:hypothetical protein [Bacteroidales bacterium]
MGNSEKTVTAADLYGSAVVHRQNKRFGEAINDFRAAISSPDASDELKAKCEASIELIQEINGFVNVDLLNP